MSSNDPEEVVSMSKEMGPNSLVEQMNEDGMLTAVACEYQTGKDPLLTNNFDVVTVEQFYDLIYPCKSNKSSIVSTIEEALLIEAAMAWDILPQGDACTDPQTSIYGTWLFGVSSLGADELISDFGCQRLTPNATKNECCQVVRSEMNFIPTGGYNASYLRQFIKDRLDQGETRPSLSIRTASIDPVFDEAQPSNDKARSNLDEPKRVNGSEKAQQGGDGTQSQHSVNRERITLTGGFIIAMLVASFLSVLFLIYRYSRRKPQRRRRHSGDTVGKDEDFCNSTMEHGPSCEDSDFHVTVVKELPTHPSFPHGFHGVSSMEVVRNHHPTTTTSDLLLFDLPLEEDDYAGTAKYTFDLSDTFKQDVMGTYAPTTMQVVAPYPMMDNSSCDSEVDSWAQTDGTVGSLEERLEEITAEI